ncbi:MAG: MarR family winged helix-turn-helix transcriptional regulator [Pseudomonadota bacterium]
MKKPSDINALIERLGRLGRSGRGEDAMNPVQWESLAYFARANRFSRSPGALTEYLGATKGTVSQTINSLERKGLVRKRVAAEDRRAISVDLTRSGEKMLAAKLPSAVDDALAGLSAVERRQLGRSLEKVLSGALQRRDMQHFGLCRTCRFFQRNHADGDPHRCGLLEEPLRDSDAELICREQTPKNT